MEAQSPPTRWQPLVVGLGRMGLGVALLLRDKGYGVRSYDHDQAVCDKARKEGLAIVENWAAEARKKDTILLLFVPHQAVDELLDQIFVTSGKPVMLDCGNSNYQDSIRRQATCNRHGIRFLDVGTSGGVSGARTGPCLTVGGEQPDFLLVENFLRSFAASLYYGGWPGAGHLIKTIHNGIEYGFLQALAEGMAVLKATSEARGQPLDLAVICETWNQGSIIASRLVADAATALRLDQDSEGKIGGGETGLWARQIAQDSGVAVPVLDGALKARQESQQNPGFASRLVALIRFVFGQHEP